MPRITAILRQNKSDRRADGTFPIYIRIAARTASYRSVRLFVKPEHWVESEQMVSKSHPKHKEYNKIIAARLAEIEAAQLELEAQGNRYTASDIKVRSRQSEYQDFISYATQHNKRYEANYFTGKKKRGQLAALLQYAPDMRWSHITPRFIRSYIDSMKHLAGQTISHRISYLQQLVTEAHRDKVYRFEDDPFAGIVIPTKIRKKDGLSPAELEAFRKVLLPPGTVMRKAQLTFLLQCYLMGIRIGDLLKLKSEQIRDGILTYTSSKANDLHRVEIIEQAQVILNELHGGGFYLLPFLKETKDLNRIGREIETSTALINARLKVIALRAGIDRPVSTHDARRTFIQLASKLPGVNPYDLQDAMGHSSAAMTEKYRADRSFTEANAINRKVWG